MDKFTKAYQYMKPNEQRLIDELKELKDNKFHENYDEYTLLNDLYNLIYNKEVQLNQIEDKIEDIREII